MPQRPRYQPLVLDVLANGKPPIHKVSEPGRLDVSIAVHLAHPLTVTTLPIFTYRAPVFAL